MATDRTTVSVQINRDDKAEWENAAEDFDSMSQFIRKAVRDYMTDDENTTDARSELSPEVENKIDDLLDITESMQNDVQDIRNESRLIHQEVQKTPEDTKELASEMFEILPRESDVLTQPIEGGDVPIFDGEHVPSGRPEDIAEHFNARLSNVEDALQTLAEDYHMVQMLTIEGERRYYKDV